jgi:hypothetical protein
MKKTERKIKFITGTKGREAFSKACKDLIEFNKDLEDIKKVVIEEIEVHLKEEFRKCKEDPNYFIQKYGVKYIKDKKSDK